ncbi:TPA: hypothetical protein DEB00_00115 [Candidatus Uhrbacteria bacterium]|nr:hypothetical protein [Candidatus Uhrbacteria bacterium]
MKVRVLILAGGKGTRMGASVPKALVPICGKPIIDYILDAVKTSGVDPLPALVVGHDLEGLRAHVGDRAEFVIQQEQKGTGHAVMVAQDQLKDADVVLVSYGDHPFYQAQTYQQILEKHLSTHATITMLTTVLPDFADWKSLFLQWGRIVRTNTGEIIDITEYALCSDEEKKITEVNNGMYCFNGEWLWNNIDQLRDDNAKKEFFLTDLIELALQQKRIVETVHCDPEQGIGVNTPAEVAIAECLVQDELL